MGRRVVPTQGSLGAGREAREISTDASRGEGRGRVSDRRRRVERASIEEGDDAAFEHRSGPVIQPRGRSTGRAQGERPRKRTRVKWAPPSVETMGPYIHSCAREHVGRPRVGASARGARRVAERTSSHPNVVASPQKSSSSSSSVNPMASARRGTVSYDPSRGDEEKRQPPRQQQSWCVCSKSRRGFFYRPSTYIDCYEYNVELRMDTVRLYSYSLTV